MTGVATVLWPSNCISAAALTRPLATSWPRMRAEVETIALCADAGVSCGETENASAARPATKGAAIDVPHAPVGSKVPPIFTATEQPGAETLTHEPWFEKE